MLSLIGSLIWIAIWIYYGVQMATIDDENGPILATAFFLPACFTLLIVGKFGFAFDLDNSKIYNEYLIFSHLM